MLRRPAGLVSLLVCLALLPATGCGAKSENKPENKAKTVLEQWYKGIAAAKSLAGETSASFSAKRGGQEVRSQHEAYTFAVRRPTNLAMRSKDARGLSLVNDDKQFYQVLGDSKVYKTGEPYKAVGDMFSKSVIMSQLNLGQGLSLLGDALAADTPEKFFAGLGTLTYLGEETLDGENYHRLTVVFQKVPQEVLISMENQPKLRRVTPDLKARAVLEGDTPPAGLDVKMTVDFVKWAYDETPPADAFAMAPPADFEKVDDLFSRPAERLRGKSAPPFEAKTLDGQTFKLADQAGKIVVLDFWATWCHPCVVALPIVNETVAKYKSQGVVFQTVNKGDDPTVIREFLASQKLDVPVLLDPTDAVCGLFRADMIPLTVIIDKTGKVQVVHVGAGPDVGEKLAKELDQILAGKDLSTVAGELP